jgi:PAS domain S-box-containing protein
MVSPDESAALLAAIIASADDAIVSKDLDGVVTSWNRSAERMFGFTAAEMVGEHISRIIPEDRLTEEDFVLAQVKAGRGVQHFETVRRRKDGVLLDISLTVSPVLAADGRVIGASKIARDVTEQKRLERDAVRLAAIVASSDDAIVSKDLNGIVQTWNAGAERIFGYAEAEMVGRSITTIIPRDRLPEEDHVLSRIRAGLSVDHFETVRQRKDGTFIDVSLSVSPIHAKNGTVIGASKIARDITEQRRLRRALEEASRAKDEFLATLSHELRTPLNTVLGYTQMLRSGAVPERDMGRALGIIARNAEALTQLVNDILDTSRIVTGKIVLQLRDCDLAAVVEEAVAAVAPAARARTLALTASLPRGLLVQGDPARLRQVFSNLLSNAVKFTPPGGIVRVSAGVEDHAVRVSVADTGVGIAADSLPYVFGRFWQEDPARKDGQPGLGLGLALVRDFVELHGGRVEAHSEGLGRGARFDVILPAAAPASSAV